MNKYLLLDMSPTNFGNIKGIEANNIDEAKEMAARWVYQTHDYASHNSGSVIVQIIPLQEAVIHRVKL